MKLEDNRFTDFVQIKTIPGQCSLFMPPKNMRKPYVF